MSSRGEYSSSRKGKRTEEGRRRRKMREKRSDDRSRSVSPQSSKKEEKSMKSTSQQIPGYNEMSPAERLRAKMKIMFDKTSKDTPSQQEPALDFNPLELSAIESEGFKPQKFQSTRKVKSEDTIEYTTHEEAMFGKSDVLPTTQVKFTTRKKSPVLEPQVQPVETTSHVIFSSDERKIQWIKKLKQLRNKYPVPPSD